MSQTREQELENTVVEYRNQLSTVIAAINADFDGTNSEELRALKTSLEEVIAFTEVELIAVKKQALLDRLSSCGADGDNDDIHCVFDGHNGNAFVDHRYGDAMPSTSSSSRSFTDRIGDNIYQKQEEVDGDSDHKELMDSIRAMNGSKCLAPYVEQNGTVGHHNAIIMITDEELSATNSDCDIRVKVLFTNPICRSMKPCAHYMSGKCRYSDDKCHYSHGHRVSFHSIKPYEEVDHSLITKDSVCLAKCATDELWYKAVIDEYQEHTHKFVVKYLKGGIIDTVDIEHLLPLNANTSDTSDDSSTSDDDSGEESQEEVTPHVPKLALRHGIASALGEWEMHTKGIGSKLMRKMGYVFGEGLGKNSEGRTEPIEVTIFPAGKSLDMCMRIRERKAGKDPIKHMRRQWAKKAAINAKLASGYNRANNKPNGSVFDFINNKVAKSGAKCDNSDKDDASNRHALPLSKLKSTDNQSLNVLSLKIAEHTRKAELELSRLQCSIETRKSKSRETQTVTHLESQVVKQRNLIKSLRDQEFAIQRELKLRSNNKKLEIF